VDCANIHLRARRLAITRARIAAATAKSQAQFEARAAAYEKKMQLALRKQDVSTVNRDEVKRVLAILREKS
jgi:hypothetical protein